MIIDDGTMEPDSHERRRHSRIATMILCELAIGDAELGLVRVRDLSRTGIKIVSSRRFQLGERVRVRLPGAMPWVDARVAWCGRDIVGLAFVRAVELPQVSGAKVMPEKSPATQRRCQSISSNEMSPDTKEPPFAQWLF